MTEGNEMWLYVLFDLPTITVEQRKKANDFRIGLKKLGFECFQYSVYRHFYPTKAQATTAERFITKIIPRRGLVAMMLISDQQNENIVVYRALEPVQQQRNVEQLLLL